MTENRVILCSRCLLRCRIRLSCLNCKLCCQDPDVTVVGTAASPQDLQAQSPVQCCNGLAEDFGILLHQAAAVVQLLRAQRGGIGQKADDPLPNQGG